jgi:parallel beta-helix repeat protein
LIHKLNGSVTNAYVEIKDLRLNNSLEIGINLFYVDQAKVTNCYIYRSNWGTGIQVARSNNVIVDGNTVNGAGYSNTALNAGISITASGSLGGSQNCQVINNIVFNGHAEGIDILQGAENVLVSGNTIYDNMAYHIYCDAARYVEITNNVCYRSTSNPFSWSDTVGIAVDNEAWQDICYSRDISIHGNYIANFGCGIMIGSQMPYPCSINNVKAYSNILADNLYSYLFWAVDGIGWTGNDLYYNISYTSNNSKMAHADNFSKPGITWGANIFDDSVSGNAAKNAIIADILVKKTGWTSLTAGSVDRAYFNITSAGSELLRTAFGITPKVTVPKVDGLRIDSAIK